MARLRPTVLDRGTNHGGILLPISVPLHLKATSRFYVVALETNLVGEEDEDARKCKDLSATLCEPYRDQAVTLDTLTGGCRVFQLKRGHRFSNDDLFTAWRAALHMPNAKKLLDLGSGIGSVGLSTLAKMRSHDASLVCLEAQEVSFQLASASIKENGLSGRVAHYRGDLRNSQAVLAQHFEKRRAHVMQQKGGGGSVESVSVVVGDDEGNKKQGQEEGQEEDELFDLITGSPPYLPAEASLISPVSQRAHCRVELRGSVYDYCAAAALHLRPDTGRFVFVMLAQDPRTEDAPLKAGLVVLERVEYTFMGGRKPHIATLVCAKPSSSSLSPLSSTSSSSSYSSTSPPTSPPTRPATSSPPPPTPHPPSPFVERAELHMLIRDVESGQFTEEHRAFKRAMLREGPLQSSLEDEKKEKEKEKESSANNAAARREGAASFPPLALP